jgi:hypothetical protein
MKVLNLRCANGHGFEGWFGSEDDFLQQNGSGALRCPLCNDAVITRLPSAPRLNLSGAREPQPQPPAAARKPEAAEASASPARAPGAPAAPGPRGAKKPAGAAEEAGEGAVQAADLQALWLQTVRHLMDNTEDVGEHFAEQARRMHYGEEPVRGIRGQATPEERAALLDEGIETLAIPVPAALKGPVQ